jgi:hypothetical protein
VKKEQMEFLLERKGLMLLGQVLVKKKQMEFLLEREGLM